MATHLPETTLRKLRRVGQALNALVRVAPPLAGRAAFRLFCSPRRQPMLEQDRNFLLAARQENLEVQGGAISTYHWPAKANSNGRNVLFLHGWESHSARWRQYVKTLCKAGFSVQAIDAPASGLSAGRLLNLTLFSAAVDKFIENRGMPYAIVGHSLGGGVAVMSAAMLRETRPEKMVLLAAFAETRRIIRDFCNIVGANDAVLLQVEREIERVGKLPMDSYSIVEKVLRLHDVQGLVMHDRDDSVAPVAEGRLLAERWPATYIETQGLGHRMQDKTVVQAVRDFLL